jgi:diguanylate cyclase (GGDEF)-like protein
MAAASFYPPTFHQVVELLEVGAIDDALGLANNALRGASPRDAALLLCVRANALVATGEPFGALKSADEAHRLATSTPESLVLAEAKLSLAQTLQALDKHALAIELATDGAQLGKENGDPEMVARSWRALGISMSVLGRHEVAIDYLTRSVALFQECMAPSTRILHAHYSLLNARSRALSPQGDGHGDATFAKLCDDWEQFALFVIEEKNTRLYAMALGNVAIAARRAGRVSQALEQFRRALELQERLQLRAHCAMTQCHIGSVLVELGEAADALAAFERGIALFQEGNPRDLASALEEYSLVLEKEGRVSDALAALRRVREVEKALGDEAGHAAISRIERDNEISKLSLTWARLADEDALTGLPNRRAFERRLRELVENGESSRFSLCIIDIDFFKQINDTFGHDVGDQVLKEVGRIIREQRIPGSLGARIGGEEFAILFFSHLHPSPLEQIELWLRALREVDWQRIAEGLAVTASAGLVSSDELLDTLEDISAARIMKRADERLYQAKRSGRNRVCNR